MIIQLFKFFKKYLQNDPILEKFFNEYYLLRYPKDAAYPFILFNFNQQKKISSMKNDLAMKVNLDLIVMSIDEDFEKINKIYHHLLSIFKSKIFSIDKNQAQDKIDIIIHYMESNVKADNKGYIAEIKLKIIIFDSII